MGAPGWSTEKTRNAQRCAGGGITSVVDQLLKGLTAKKFVPVPLCVWHSQSFPQLRAKRVYRPGKSAGRVAFFPRRNISPWRVDSCMGWHGFQPRPRVSAAKDGAPLRIAEGSGTVGTNFAGPGSTFREALSAVFRRCRSIIQGSIQVDHRTSRQVAVGERGPVPGCAQALPFR